MEKLTFKFFKTVFARGYLNIHDNVLVDYIQSTKTIKHPSFFKFKLSKRKNFKCVHIKST